jgi:hypothetical protein
MRAAVGSRGAGGLTGRLGLFLFFAPLTKAGKETVSVKV